MPTLWAHGLYFNNSSTAVAPTLAASGGGYPLWQAGVITPSLLGGCQALWERLVWWLRLLRAVWRLPVRLRRQLDAQLAAWTVPVTQAEVVTGRRPGAGVVVARHGVLVDRPGQVVQRPFFGRRVTTPTAPVPDVLLQAAVLVAHPAYPAALAAVERTRTTLGFSRPEAWQALSRQMKQSPGDAENIFRHLQACQWTRETAGSTLSNPDCHLLVELAYHQVAG